MCRNKLFIVHVDSCFAKTSYLVCPQAIQKRHTRSRKHCGRSGRWTEVCFIIFLHYSLLKVPLIVRFLSLLFVRTLSRCHACRQRNDSLKLYQVMLSFLRAVGHIHSFSSTTVAVLIGSEWAFVLEHYSTTAVFVLVGSEWIVTSLILGLYGQTVLLLQMRHLARGSHV